MKRVSKCKSCQSKNIEVFNNQKELKEWRENRITAGLTAKTVDKIITAMISTFAYFVKLLIKKWFDSKEEQYAVCNDCGEMWTK